MARLIDADQLIKEANADGAYGYVDAKQITDAPTVDAVPVVRCRDCAKLGLFTCPICFIEKKTLQFVNISPDFFCGEGERKDGDGNG